MNVEDVIDFLETDNPDLRKDYIRCLYRYASWVPENGRILEIGCYRGDSTVALRAGSHPSVELHSIDPIFKTGTITYPDAHPPYFHTLSSDIEKVLGKVKKFGERFAIWPLTSREAQDNPISRSRIFPIDFLFVDGEHTYEAVLRDCHWLDTVKPGGFAAFDDWIEPVERAVRRFISDRPEWTIVYESTLPPTKEGICITLLKRS